MVLGVESLDLYLNRSELSETNAICVILNPRMKLKKLVELGWSSEQRARDRDAFFAVYETYVDRYAVSVDEGRQVEDDYSEDELAYEIQRVVESPVPEDVYQQGSEAERWLGTPCQPKSDKSTYSEYWKGMVTVYPILSRMARDYGCILASSVPSESVFSLAGLQIRKNRSRLAPKSMGIIMCLRSWGCLPEEVRANGVDDDEVVLDARQEYDYWEKDEEVVASGGGGGESSQQVVEPTTVVISDDEDDSVFEDI